MSTEQQPGRTGRAGSLSLRSRQQPLAWPADSHGLQAAHQPSRLSVLSSCQFPQEETPASAFKSGGAAHPVRA